MKLCCKWGEQTSKGKNQAADHSGEPDTGRFSTKGYSSGYNLADLCLQMAITNKARNLEK